MAKNGIVSIIETIVINTIIYLMFYTMQPNQDIYLFLNPHPLLILCIVMALRYGNYLGMLSATISSLFFINVFVSVYGDITLIITDFDYYKYPLLFFVIAAILGFFKDNKDTIIENLTNDKKLLQKEYRGISKKYKENNKILTELKKQIIDSDESILNLYEIASKLETLDSEEVYTEMIGILTKYLNANRVSIYTYNQNSNFLRIKIYTGDRENNASLSLNDSPGLKRVIEEKVPIRWVEVKESGFPLMAAPIIKDNSVLAIVCIDNMDFDKLSEYAYQLFKLIVDWVNKSLERAIYVDGLKESKYINGTNLMKYKYFTERLKEEERRKIEFGMNFCLITYRVRKLDIQKINSIVSGLLRSMDIICYDSSAMTLYLLLPATSNEKKYLVERRVEERLGFYIENIKT